ncbi:MAG: hypothetical protein ACLQUY_01040 [Ktedonobacterales bacterium]
MLHHLRAPRRTITGLLVCSGLFAALALLVASAPPAAHAAPASVCPGDVAPGACLPLIYVQGEGTPSLPPRSASCSPASLGASVAGDGTSTTVYVSGQCFTPGSSVMVYGYDAARNNQVDLDQVVTTSTSYWLCHRITDGSACVWLVGGAFNLQAHLSCGDQLTVLAFDAKAGRMIGPAISQANGCSNH